MADVHIEAGHFPNSTTLYIWEFSALADDATIAAAEGGKVLTRVGNLTQQNNHLATPVSVYCEMDGTNDYAKSTDAVFAFTGDVSMGGWFYHADWTTETVKAFMSRLTGAGVDGWMMIIKDTTPAETQFQTHSSSSTTSALVWDQSGLAAGWHHFVIVRDESTDTKLYVDKVLKVTNTDATQAIQAAGDLNIGSRVNGQIPWIGRVQDIFIHDGTLLNQTQIDTIYDAVALSTDRSYDKLLLGVG